jgi:uncharacterized tellurite resistance protein B-like protein
MDDLELRLRERPGGVLVRLRWIAAPNGAGVGLPTAVRLRVLDHTGNDYLSGVAMFEDAEGFFSLFVPLSDGRGEAFLPFAALNHAMVGVFMLEARAMSRGPAGHYPVAEIAAGLSLPPPTSWTTVMRIQPLVGLCMGMIQAAGDVDPQEVDCVRRVLIDRCQIPENQHSGLEELIASEPSANLPELARRMRQFLPELDAEAVLRVLGEIATAHGAVDSRELAALKTIAGALGVEGDAWERLSQPLAIYGTEAIETCYAVLGLQQGCSSEDVRQAYARQVEAYSPDRVAALPEEFQDLAALKIEEFSRARRALLAVLKKQGA